MSDISLHRQTAEALFLPVVSSGGARGVAIQPATVQQREMTARLRAELPKRRSNGEQGPA